MGRGLISRCESCGYEFTGMYGIGFMFPQTYNELIEQAKSGELGEEVKCFLDANPNGAIDAEQVTLCCTDCGNLETGYDLSMWIPKGEAEPADYVTHSDLEESYNKVENFPHKCSKCSGSMKVIRAANHNSLKCPKCKVKMTAQPGIMWD